MKTIKVIDLLNKIANGEKVPNIKIRNRIYKFCTTNFAHNDSGHLIFGFNFDNLNDEVEIIEEEKEIEKLELHINYEYEEFNDELEEDMKSILFKINELINAVNEIRKEK